MKMNNEVMFSSNTDNWSTPQHVFDELNEEFHFNLDPCAVVVVVTVKLQLVTVKGYG